MQSYYTTIPTYITTREDLLDGEKIFYGVVQSLCNKYGFCWASNDTLAKIAHKKSRQIQNYIRKLRDVGLIFVEIEYKNERKIWTRETWSNRDELKKCFDQDLAFNQRFDRYAMDCVGGTQWSAYNKYNDINISKEKEDEARTKPPASPTVHLLSKNKITEQTSASPPKPKEKPPSKDCIRTFNDNVRTSNSKSDLELTEQERKMLRDRLGSDLEKYEAKRLAHLKKCPKSLYHKKRAYETILEWYNRDREEMIMREQARTENKTQASIKRAKKGKKLVKDILEQNPQHTHVLSPYQNCVEIGLYSTGGGRQSAEYDDPDLYRKIEDMLKKVKRYEGLDYKMPLTEKEYLE